LQNSISTKPNNEIKTKNPKNVFFGIQKLVSILVEEHNGSIAEKKITLEKIRTNFLILS